MYSARVKRFARELDPSCWGNSSGASLPSHEQRVAARRIASLEEAKRFTNSIDKIASETAFRNFVSVATLS